jgi:PncC family amidohydrolase
MSHWDRLISNLEESIYSKVLDVIRLLRESNRTIVLAESCTGGLVSSWFVRIPGVSDVFCGSMVVYRNDTKAQWLGIDRRALVDPRIGPVGMFSSENLATNVIRRTPEADFALGITGHLGPAARSDLDHRVFLVWAARQLDPSSLPCTHRHLQLEIPAPENSSGNDDSTQMPGPIHPMTVRRYLQSKATFAALEFADEMLHKDQRLQRTD